MEEYGEAGVTQCADADGDIVGMDTIKIFRCTNPECSNYNLLQGNLE